MSQLHLLTERRFWPLFWTQFLGAFNDNLFKNALVILIAYRSMSLLGIGSATIVVACAGIFIFPFFLFSATAGQLADHYPKWILMRWVKVWEIGVMILAGVGFATNSLALLLTVLFLMGMQSTFFGPAKYAILPELLDDETLVGGNALVEPLHQEVARRQPRPSGQLQPRQAHDRHPASDPTRALGLFIGARHFVVLVPRGILFVVAAEFLQRRAWRGRDRGHARPRHLLRRHRFGFDALRTSVAAPPRARPGAAGLHRYQCIRD
jgi:hypothetical protein